VAAADAQGVRWHQALDMDLLLFILTAFAGLVGLEGAHQPDHAVDFFDTEVTGQNPTILRDSITVTAHLTAGGDKTIVYSYASAPALVKAAVAYTTESVNTDFSGDPIDGSPWYDCTDTVIRGFAE
jgi:hypothetical protein